MSDIDNDTLSSATITVTNYKNGDVVGADNLPSGISATTTINALGYLVVTLNGTATVLEYENAIESLTFTSTSADRTPRDFEFVVNDGNKDSNTMSLKVDIGGCIINTYTPDNDAPIIVDAAAVVSEEGLINGIADDAGSTDTTNNTTIVGKMNITDTENNTLNINLTSPNTTITAGGIEVVWSGNGTKELVGTANNTQVIKISIDNNGNYEVKLFASVDHPQNSVEDTLSFDVGVTANDGTNVTNGTLSVTIEDDMPTVNSTNAVAINIDNSQFTNLVINGSFEDITGHRVAGSGNVGFIVDQDISSGSWSGMQSMEGWELISGRSFWMEPHHIEHAGVGVTDGTNYMDLGETNQNNDSDMDNTHIGQIIGCIQDGTVYNLSFAFKDKAFTQANEPQSGKMEVIWGGEVIATIDGNTTDWETFTIEVIGGYGNGSNRLEFKEIGEGSDNWGIAIDNVSMSAKSITYSGNIAADAGVLINFGADGQADGSGTKVDSSKLSFALAETSGWTLQNNGNLVSNNGNITISIDGTTGDYTITQTGVIDNVSLNIPVTITDGDGDSVTADIKLNAQNTPVCELPSQIFATIINNDSVTEGGVLSHKVVLVDVNGNEVRIPAGEFVEINLTYVANSTNGATQGADYTAQETVRIYGGTSGVLVFNSTINDNNFENNESYTVSITGISSSDTTLDSKLNISSTQSSVTGTIIDDDTNTVIATDDYGTATVAQGEFVVDAFADGKAQSAPNVASLKDGGFVIAWTEVSGNSYNGAVSNDLNNDGDLNDSGEITWATRINHDVFIQRYDADSEPVGDATRVNTLVTNVNADGGRSQHDVNVVGLENGNYLVTWTSDDQFISKDNYDNGSRYIQGQIFDVNGNPVCGEFTVARAEYDPIVALPDGGFIVTWSADARLDNTDLGALDNPIYSDSHDGSGFGVIAQRFDALGNEVGGRVIVNQLTSNDQFDSDIVMIDDTTAIMTWQSQNGTSGNFDIYAQTLNLTANGLEVVSNTDIAVATGSANQINPEITALSNGTAVITYQSDSNIMARTISNGTVGQEMTISSGSNPVIAALAIGFAIAYEESGAIYAKTFDGTTLSDAVKVSSSTSGQTLSSIASLKDGGYVITWQDDSGISAHRYNADGTEYHQNEFDMMEDSSIIITADRLMTNDMDPEGHTFKVVSVQDATHGNVSMDANGNITFAPDADYNGAATFKYTIQDELGATDTATVYLNVKPMGEPTIFVGTLCDADIQSHDIVVNEGEVAILAVKVSGAEAGSTVSLALEDGTALITQDYSSKFYYSFDGTSWTEYSDSVQLNGHDKFLVKMTTLNDAYLESNENFKLVATLNSTESSEVSDTGTVTIIDTTIPNNLPTSMITVNALTYSVDEQEVMTYKEPSGNTPKDISHIKYFLSNGTTVKIDYPSSICTNSAAQPLNLIGNILSGMSGVYVVDFYIKSGTSVYNIYGEYVGGFNNSSNTSDPLSNIADKTITYPSHQIAGKVLDTISYKYTIDVTADDEFNNLDVVMPNGEKATYNSDTNSYEYSSNIKLDTQHIEIKGEVVFSDANDIISIENLEQMSGIDAGAGYDTLKLVSNQHIDFSQIGNVIKNIEEIDLSADGKNELRNITLQDVIEMTDDKNEIKITGTDEDKVTLSGEWKLNTTLSDSEFNVYSNEDETVKLKIQTDITDITVS